MVGIFMPDDLAAWPGIDPTNPEYQRDLASLNARGSGMEDHEQMMHAGGHSDHGSN
jgi:hypothetical protein